MCGIAGVISSKNIDTVFECKTMLSKMIHRGPDDEGVQTDIINGYNISLGHRRLSIIELSQLGHQPMSFEHLTLVFNGEIYNYKEIKVELENLGYNFLSNSDTEVVLKAYHMWGSLCFSRFNGMWAIAILDKNSDKLILCRDRAGVKPLYWFKIDGDFVFASELKALIKFSLVKKELCPIGLPMYFQFGYIKDPYTIYNDINKLTPGSYLQLDINNDLQIETFTYWNIYEFYRKDKLDIDYKTAKITLEEKMHKAFNYRMISEVPVGLFLSGGYDSSALAAILQSSCSSKIETFTIGFNSDKFNEAPNAKKIAAHLGTSHNELYCSLKDIEDGLSKLPDILDEPFADSSILPTLLVSSFAKQKVTVALSADGGDELFIGYPAVVDSLRVYSILNSIPQVFKSLSFKTIGFLLNSKIIHGTKPNKLLELLNAKSALQILEINSKSIFRKELGQFKCSDIGLYNSDAMIKDDLDLMLLNLFNLYLTCDVLHKLDVASMRYSIESREPFLDKELVEFVVQLPNEFKMDKSGSRKVILKDIVHNYIPEQFFHTRKMGFSVPPSEIEAYVNRNLDFSLLDKLVTKKIIPKELSNHQTLKLWRVKWNVFIFLTWYKANML